VLAETKLNPIRPRVTRRFDGVVTGVTVVTSRAMEGRTGGMIIHFALQSLDPPRELVTGIIEPPRVRGKRTFLRPRTGQRPRTRCSALCPIGHRSLYNVSIRNRPRRHFDTARVSPCNLSAVGFAGRDPAACVGQVGGFTHTEAVGADLPRGAIRGAYRPG
jgi:hypothetical protein